MIFQFFYHPQALGIMRKALMIQLIQSFFAGMSEGCMTQIMA